MPRKKKETETIITDKEMQDSYNVKKVYNDYDTFVSDYVEGFISKMYSDGILKTISSETLQKWLSSPDTYMSEITSLLNYYYIVNGDIFQLYDLVFSLPKLNYKIKSYTKTKRDDKNIQTINKMLSKIKYKELCRDLLSQTASEGTTVCTWLGDKKNPYLYVFDNLKYIFPAYRKQGQMVAQFDLELLETMKDNEREQYFNNLSPHITKTKYEKFIKSKKDEDKYIELPLETTSVLRTHTLKRNQRLGIPMGTQSLFGLQHKQKLKDLEVSIANKIIQAIAVLKFKGKDDSDTKVPLNKQKKVYGEVKKALTKNQKDSLTVIGLPDYASFEFPEIRNGEKALDPNKYESINKDLSSSIGVSPVLTSGMDGNFASAKLNLEMLYRKIGVLLEQIEEVFNKCFVLLTGTDNYYIEFDKNVPLSTKEKIDIFMKLHSEGFAIKPIIDLIDGIDYREYIEQSIYEIDELKLREKIIPPTTSYTLSGKDNGNGRGIVDNPENDNTITSKENGGNTIPRAGV